LNNAVKGLHAKLLPKFYPNALPYKDKYLTSIFQVAQLAKFTGTEKGVEGKSYFIFIIYKKLLKKQKEMKILKYINPPEMVLSHMRTNICSPYSLFGL
jgi:hypothetical protein